MNLSVGRYTTILSIQTVLLLIDFAINVVLILARRHNGAPVILFIVQCGCLILALFTLLFTFFTTTSFHAGLVSLFYERFRTSLFVYMIYFVLTTALHISFLVTGKENTDKFNWSTELYCLFILQRMITPFYYYYYKRACLLISDPRYYDENTLWDEQNTSNTN